MHQFKVSLKAQNEILSQVSANATNPDANKQGWKDTIRDIPQEMLTIMEKFEFRRPIYGTLPLH